MLTSPEQLSAIRTPTAAKLSSPLRIVGLTTLFSSIYGCGGGSSPPPPPPIAVSLSPNAISVQAGATAQLTATVVHDHSDSGVSWKLTCSIAPSLCGMLSSPSSPSGTPVNYTPPTPLPPSGTTITITATSAADNSKSDSASIIPVGHIPGYDVGADYHASGADNNSTGFITIYNQPSVRQTVQQQLQGMADRGATSIQTAIWVVTEPGTTNFGQTWRATFPLTDQEAANIRAYAQDVAGIVSATGNRLRLNIALNWLGAADFTLGSPSTTLGYSNLTAAEFTTRVQTTTGKLLAAVGDITRPDGVKLVDTIFLLAEPNIQAPGEIYGTPNAGWFLTTNYPHFLSAIAPLGIRPSIYFIGCGSQNIVLDNAYVDAAYPILNGHRSMFWVYRGLKFMVDNGLPLPSGHADFDCYFDSSGATYDQLLQRILDDADATLPSLGAPRLYHIPETYYLSDPTQRIAYGQAFANQATLAHNSRLQRVSFWTTPDGGGKGINQAYPFTFESFLPPSP